MRRSGLDFGIVASLLVLSSGCIDGAVAPEVENADPREDAGRTDAHPASLIDAMQPPPPPSELVEAIGRADAELVMATCIDWRDDWSPGGYIRRPERVLRDGRMECDSSLERVSEEKRNPWLTYHECSGWPYRPPTSWRFPGGGYDPRVSCSPDLELCCVRAVFEDLTCEESWVECAAEPQTLGVVDGNMIQFLVPSEECPQAITDAFPTALNMCHFLCQPICEDR